MLKFDNYSEARSRVKKEIDESEYVSHLVEGRSPQKQSSPEQIRDYDDDATTMEVAPLLPEASNEQEDFSIQWMPTVRVSAMDTMLAQFRKYGRPRIPGNLVSRGDKQEDWPEQDGLYVPPPLAVRADNLARLEGRLWRIDAEQQVFFDENV